MRNKLIITNNITELQSTILFRFLTKKKKFTNKKHLFLKGYYVKTENIFFKLFSYKSY